MVRLKDYIKKASAEALATFQFLNGAIKRTTVGAIQQVLPLFQFLNGAIKRRLVLTQLLPCKISIPQWCD